MLLTWDASVGATGYEFCVDSVDNNACDGTWVPVFECQSARASVSMARPTDDRQVRAINGAGVAYVNGASGDYSFTTARVRPDAHHRAERESRFWHDAGWTDGHEQLTISNTGNDLLTVSGIYIRPGLMLPCGPEPLPPVGRVA